jgi:FkbM family methyltransferase
LNLLASLKALYECARLKAYHWRNGAGFRYHGVPVTIPDELKFSFKRLIIQGKYEEPERRLIDRFIDPSLPVLELGGALGIVSAYVGSRIAPHVACRIVEANPNIIGTCLANANAARTQERTVVINAAIAYDAEVIRFEANPNVHVSRVADDGNSASTHMIEVRTTTLRQQADLLAPDGRYTLIMDVEGMEYDVFQREAAALSRCALAIVEFHPKIFAARGVSTEAFFALVEKAGMTVAARDGHSVALLPR